MTDQDKTKEQLINELVEMRQRIAELEAAEIQHRRTEEALRESEERFRQVAENAQEWIWEVDAHGLYVYASPAVEKILGYKPEELVGKKHFYDLFHPEGREDVKATAFEVFALNQPFREFVNRNAHKNGEAVWLSTSGVPILDEEGHLLGYRGVDIDITERKQAEEALRESEKRLALAVDGSKGGQWYYELNPDDPLHPIEEVYFSPRLKGFIGYQDSEFPNSLSAWESRVAPEDLAVLLERSRAHREGLTDAYEMEYRIHHKDGSIRWIHSRGRVQRDERGRPIRFAGIDWDITERKQAEEALRRSEEKLRDIVEHGNNVFYIHDTQHRLTYVSPQCRQVFGYSPEEMMMAWTNLITDNPINEIGLEITERALQTGEKQELYLLEAQRKDGRKVWIEIDESPLRDDHGQVIGLVGAARDVTEQKQTEETLRRRAEELSALQATVLEITTAHDLPTLLRTIVERATGLLDAPSGGLYLCDPTHEEALCVVSYNTPSDYTGTVLKYGEGAAGTVAQTGEPLIIDDYRTWSSRAAVFDEEQPFTAVLSAPMIWQGEVTGVLHVLHNVEGRRFTQAELELLTLFANHAAIAVENARLYEKALQDARTKATLLAEVNHRVKNNLNAIIGLLHVEQSYAKTADQAAYEAIIRHLTNRIGGLSTVHSLLSASEWTPLLLSDLAGQVIKSATQIHPPDKQVFIDVPPSPLRVTPGQAHNLALIINELATNTIEHVLPQQDETHINVRIAEEDGAILFEYRDDGPGYPEDVLQLERHAVGFDLIQNLACQSLRGELSLHNDEGAVAVIRFPAQASGDTANEQSADDPRADR